jgi:outer membrane protein assembly factor BamB
VANGVVYVTSDDGKLYAFDADGCGAASCQPLSTVTTAGSPGSPAVAGGKVYVRDSSGLRAYSLP